MKKNQSQDDGPLHQTVAEGIEFKVGVKSIAVEFTEQQLSAHAGSATFWAWLHSTRWAAALGRQLPQRAPSSNHHLTPLEKALAFSHGLLCEARKLTHVASLCHRLNRIGLGCPRTWWRPLDEVTLRIELFDESAGCFAQQRVRH